MDAAKKSAREIDEMIAYRVLEWRPEGGKWFLPDGRETQLKAFSADIAAAWDFVPRVCAKGYRLQLDGSKLWQARFYKSAAHSLETRAHSATAPSPALAICRAALSVWGVEPPGSANS